MNEEKLSPISNFSKLEQNLILNAFLINNDFFLLTNNNYYSYKFNITYQKQENNSFLLFNSEYNSISKIILFKEKENKVIFF